jgi:hypothetical protein
MQKETIASFNKAYDKLRSSGVIRLDPKDL